MTTNKIEWGTSTAFTITLNSLANAAARESTAIDNTTNKYFDALVTVICAVASGTISGDQEIRVYAYGSEDGTNYTDNATGTDAALTLRAPTNLFLVQCIRTPTASVTYKSHPFSIAAAFRGNMPRKWGIVVENQSGVAFSGSGCSASYSGVYSTNT